VFALKELAAFAFCDAARSVASPGAFAEGAGRLQRLVRVATGAL
jgi:hypothetical protein